MYIEFWNNFCDSSTNTWYPSIEPTDDIEILMKNEPKLGNISRLWKEYCYFRIKFFKLLGLESKLLNLGETPFLLLKKINKVSFGRNNCGKVPLRRDNIYQYKNTLKQLSNGVYKQKNIKNVFILFVFCAFGCFVILCLHNCFVVGGILI